MKSKKLRILIVDDEPGFTTLLRYNLERTGMFEVSEVTDATQAIATARAFRPDLILLDVVMPGLDGGDLVGQIERDRILKHTPVVFVTALIDNRETGGKAIVNGDGHTYVGKPVSMSSLLNCIYTHLAAPNAKLPRNKTDYHGPPTALASA